MYTIYRLRAAFFWKPDHSCDHTSSYYCCPQKFYVLPLDMHQISGACAGMCVCNQMDSIGLFPI